MGRVRHMVNGPDGLLYLAMNAPDRLARLVPLEEADASQIARNGAPAVAQSEFGRTADGKRVELFTLTNRHGLVAKVTNYGATLTALSVPDRQGKLGGVVREIQASAGGFENGFPESGAIFGRVANRIAKGRFVLGGREYTLAINNAPNHLHGGIKNFSRVVWTATPSSVPHEAAVTLAYESPDGEEGYPGKLTATVKYTLTEQDSLRIEYSAISDQATPVNLTNHAYFNLAGDGDVLESELTLNADRYTVVDATLIPTGEIREVAGSVLDFRTGAPLGARAKQLDEGRRYDHNFVLNRPQGDKSLAFAARVVEPRSGRMMEVWTTEPGVQLYTSPLGDQPAPGKRGFFCLETQHFPDSVNRPDFPSTLLQPGEIFRSTTEFRFSVK
jgi:aldose 1-epimerase